MLEVTPDIKTRLASLKLTLSGVYQEIERIEKELVRQEKPLELPQEWLPLAEVAKIFGFKSAELFRQWARKNGIDGKKIGQKVFYCREELTAKLKAAPENGGKRPVLRHHKKPVKDDTVEATISHMFGGKRGA